MGTDAQNPACYCIKHTEIPHASRLFTDLLYHYDRVQKWYPHAPLDPTSYHAAAKTLNYPAATRALVSTVLEEQAAKLDAPQVVLDNIARLRNGANAIVTGQQVGLFGGPLYCFYKALTAIKLAATLTAEGCDTVPVFWLATEDHDLEEVNHTFVLTRDGNVETIKSDSKSPAEHAPVGEIIFTEEIAKLVEQTIAMLPESEFTAETAAMLRESYQPEETFGLAFGKFMTRLFGRFGVIVMDPRDPRMRQLAAPVFRKALESAAELYSALESRNQELLADGYHTQVYVSAETSLLFVRVNGQRIPLRRTVNGFTLDGEAVTAEYLLKELESHPQNFSPNVLLRPIVQDSLLPTLGYIGGPAELAYFAQAGVVYQEILGRMPVIAPRASFTLVDARSIKLLGRYELTLPRIFHEDEAIRERMAKRFLPPGLTATLAESETQLAAMLVNLRRELESLDHTLDDAVDRAGRKMTHQLRRLGEKSTRAVLRRDKQVDRDATHLLNYLHPRHSLQERVFSGVSFLAQHGPGLLDEIYDKVQTRSADHQPIFI